MYLFKKKYMENKYIWNWLYTHKINNYIQTICNILPIYQSVYYCFCKYTNTFYTLRGFYTLSLMSMINKYIEIFKPFKNNVVNQSNFPKMILNYVVKGFSRF